MGLRKLISKIIMNDRGISIALSKKRVMLSEVLSRNMRHTVKYGPFKGLRFTQESWWWGGADRSSMLLGIYEKEVLEALMNVPKKYNVFIEIHDWFFKDGDKKLNKLISDAKTFFNISKLTTSSRDLSVFPELSKLHDSERWLIASEGRHRLMVWLRFDPK